MRNNSFNLFNQPLKEIGNAINQEGIRYVKCELEYTVINKDNTKITKTIIQDSQFEIIFYDIKEINCHLRNVSIKKDEKVYFYLRNEVVTLEIYINDNAIVNEKISGQGELKINKKF
jgi:hypothetical protein